MNSQNQNQKPEETKKPQQSQTAGQEELNAQDQKNVSGGSGLTSGGNDLTNMIGGTIGISNSSSGTHNGESYSSNDSHQVDLGLGNILDNTNY